MAEGGGEGGGGGGAGGGGGGGRVLTSDLLREEQDQLEMSLSAAKFKLLKNAKVSNLIGNRVCVNVCLFNSI